MQIDSLGDVVLTRKLFVGGEHKREVVIKIGKPIELEGNGDYYCPYQVVGIENDKIKYAIGIDGVQAMQLTLSRIGADLYTSEEGRKGNLRWIGDENGNLGFPVPDSIKDLLPKMQSS